MTTQKRIAIIGGSGLDKFTELENVQRKVVRTPYGDPSGPITIGDLGSNQVAFIPRHGIGHVLPPHKINYRANIWAIKSLGFDSALSIASVGSVDPALNALDLVVPDQILDYTYGREHTFYEGINGEVHHIDFTYPYTQSVRDALITASETADCTVVDHGTYAATQGPRLETAAEIARYERDGATVVGMTGMPEASLAREAGLDYACLCLVVNKAAGIDDAVISLDDIRANLSSGIGSVVNLIKKLVH